MSTSALSNETLSYTYTTVPTYTATMVGYSQSNLNVGLVALAPGGSTNLLSTTILNRGIYLCQAKFAFETTAGNTVGISLSTTSSTMNNDNTTQMDVSVSATTKYLNTTAVITISAANTVLYCVGRTVTIGITQGSGAVYLKYTRIA